MSSLEKNQTEHDEKSSSSSSKYEFPRNRILWFRVICCVCVFVYLAFIVILLFIYPFKPLCYISSFEVGPFKYYEDPTEFRNSPRVSSIEGLNNSIGVYLSFENRNRATKVTYSDLNLTIYYIPYTNHSVNISVATTTNFSRAYDTMKTFEQGAKRVSDMYILAPLRADAMSIFNQTNSSVLEFQMDAEIAFKLHNKANQGKKKGLIHASVRHITIFKEYGYQGGYRRWYQPLLLN